MDGRDECIVSYGVIGNGFASSRLANRNLPDSGKLT